MHGEISRESRAEPRAGVPGRSWRSLSGWRSGVGGTAAAEHAGFPGQIRRPRLGASRGQLGEDVFKNRHTAAQLVEILLWYDRDVHGGAGTNRGVSGPI